MEIFPGAYVAKQSLTAAIFLGAIIITILAYRIDSSLREIDHVSPRTFPYTKWLGVATFIIEPFFLANRSASPNRNPTEEDTPQKEIVLDLAWSVISCFLWLVDGITVTIVVWDCEWSASNCARSGFLSAFVWIQWLLLTSRLIVIAAEQAKIRLDQVLKALGAKLAPWFKAAQEPLVQVAASLGILLSGVVGSLGMLVTGVVGVVDRTLDIVGLGGIRRSIVRGLGLDKAMDKFGVNKVLGGMGLDGIFGGPPPASRSRSVKKGTKGDASDSKSGGLAGTLGLGGSGSKDPSEATTTRKRDRKQGGDQADESAQGGLSQIPVVGSVVGGVGSAVGGVGNAVGEVGGLLGGRKT